MKANRAFSLLMGLGAGGLVLLMAAGIRLVLGARLDQHSPHQSLDGVCVIVPVHGDFLSHILSYSTTFLLFGLVGLALRYVGKQAVESRMLRKDTARAIAGSSDDRLSGAITKTGVKSKVFLVPSQAKQAFTAELWRPSIYVTSGLVEALTAPQLEAVLLHEEHHAQRRDPLQMVVGHALATLLFFLPILRNLHSYWDIEKEVEADAAAVNQQGTRAYLASALYKLGALHDVERAGAVGFNEATSMDTRIRVLSNGRRQDKPFTASALRWSIAGVLLLLALIGQPWTTTHAWWVIALSLAACPGWLLLFWGQQRWFSWKP